MRRYSYVMILIQNILSIMSFSLRFVCSIVWKFFTENSNLAESGIPGKFNPDSGVADREQSVVHYRVKIQKCHYCVINFPLLVLLVGWGDNRRSQKQLWGPPSICSYDQN